MRKKKNPCDAMMIPGLSESQFQQYAAPESISRGRDYFRAGAVVSVIKREKELQGQVEGSSFEPYLVRITFDEGGLTGAECTCPYYHNWGGWCKHIVAVLLRCLHAPDEVEERSSLESLLRDMSREQLVELIQGLTANDPALVDRIELRARQLQAIETSVKGAGGGDHKTVIDPKAIKRQIRSILHSLDRMRASEAYWHVGEVVNEVRREIEQAWTFIEAGDCRNALSYLAAITEVYLEEWGVLDDSDGEAGGLFFELGESLTEAVLMADLSSEERESWAEKIADWESELSNYGVDDAFGAAVRAAEQGWDDPDLRRVLEGEDASASKVWEDEDSVYSEGLTRARLDVLDRQGRHEEYLRLAEAAGQLTEYLVMLVRLDRIGEATEKGLQYLTTVEEALSLGRALRERGALEEALAVGEKGLKLEGLNKAHLATWVSDLAMGMGRTDRALEAALVAYYASPGLVSYQYVQTLSGEKWPQYRDRLLDHLRGGAIRDESKINIFLQEGLIDEAIASVGRWTHYELVRRVVEAAIETHPEWVVIVAKQQAEPIMDEGRSDIYHHAVDWLAYVRNAFLKLGSPDEWEEYLSSLKEKFSRKRKLMGLIKERF